MSPLANTKSRTPGFCSSPQKWDTSSLTQPSAVTLYSRVTFYFSSFTLFNLKILDLQSHKDRAEYPHTLCQTPSDGNTLRNSGAFVTTKQSYQLWTLLGFHPFPTQVPSLFQAPVLDAMLFSHHISLGPSDLPADWSVPVFLTETFLNTGQELYANSLPFRVKFWPFLMFRLGL